MSLKYLISKSESEKMVVIVKKGAVAMLSLSFLPSGKMPFRRGVSS